MGRCNSSLESNMTTDSEIPERQIRITVSEDHLGTCIGIVNAANGLVRDMSREPELKSRIVVVADVPLTAYAKVAADIGTSTSGNAVVERIER